MFFGSFELFFFLMGISLDVLFFPECHPFLFTIWW